MGSAEQHDDAVALASAAGAQHWLESVTSSAIRPLGAVRAVAAAA
jgi:hypothetical protein